MSSLNPVYRIGDQIVEQIRAHDTQLQQGAGDRPRRRADGARRDPARSRAAALLPARVLGRHAPARDDRDGALVLAEAADRRRADDGARRDDPGPDPRGAADAARARPGPAIILVTHDLAVVADIADRVIVMYSGRVVEQGTLDELFYDPQHPYTWGLLGSITRIDRDRARAPARDPGLPPSLLKPPPGLPLPAALPARLRPLHRGARADARDPRAPSTSIAAG